MDKYSAVTKDGFSVLFQYIIILKDSFNLKSRETDAWPTSNISTHDVMKVQSVIVVSFRADLPFLNYSYSLICLIVTDFSNLRKLLCPVALFKSTQMHIKLKLKAIISLLAFFIFLMFNSRRAPNFL